MFYTKNIRKLCQNLRKYRKNYNLLKVRFRKLKKPKLRLKFKSFQRFRANLTEYLLSRVLQQQHIVSTNQV